MKAWIGFTVLLMTYCVPAFPWGADGHKIVGLIAAQKLTAKTKSKLQLIMGSETFDNAAVWADEIKKDASLNDFKPWHYGTIDDNQIYDPTLSLATGDVVKAIETQKNVLLGNSISPGNDPLGQNVMIQTFNKLKQYFSPPVDEKLAAVRFLAHFIGDIHQPLHIGNSQDRGGNLCQVTWYGKKSRNDVEAPAPGYSNNHNLHSIWDSTMLLKAMTDDGYVDSAGKPDDQKYADYLLKYVSSKDVASWLTSVSDDWQLEAKAWATESQTVRMKIYPDGNKKYTPSDRPYCTTSANIKLDPALIPDLSEFYYKSNRPVMDKRLLQAGIRLAGVLNAVFDPSRR